MKSNKGFTLIELLAVIVILAIIALIATPMILGVVEDARKSAAASSANGYVDAIEKQIMIKAMDDESLLTGMDDKTVFTVDEINAVVTVKGDAPDKGSVEIANDEVVQYSIHFKNGYTVTKTSNGITASKNDVKKASDADTITATSTSSGSGSGSTGNTATE